MHIEKKVIFAGVRKDTNKLYSVMDVFCLPSLYEGLGMVVWEATANGVPTLLSDRVPKEANIECYCSVLSLKQKPQIWAEELRKRNSRNSKVVPSIKDHEIDLMNKYIFYCNCQTGVENGTSN